MNELLFVPVLAAALGIDLGLALLVLGVLPLLGLEVAWLDRIVGLQAPAVLAIVAVFWVAETLLEQVSVTVMALWHAAQAVARPAAAFLLTGILIPDVDPAVRIAAMVAMAVLAGVVHAGAVGWLAFLHLIGLPTRSRRVASAAEDAVVMALVVLGVEHPLAALGVVLALVAAGFQQHMTSLAGFQLLLRGVVGDARSLIAEGSWWPSALQPDWPAARLAREGHRGPLLADLARFRGTPAALLQPGPARLRYGWLLVADGYRCFVPRRGPVVELGSRAAQVRREPMLTRVAWTDGHTLFVPPDGPTSRELEVEFLH